MSLLDSISFPLKVWRLASLNPFSPPSTLNTTPNKLHKFVHIIVIFAFVSFSVPCVVLQFEEALKVADLWHRAYGFILTFIYYSTLHITIIESFVAERKQIKLLTLFQSIDSILIDEIGIQINYTAEKQLHKSRVIRWMLLVLPAQILFSVASIAAGQPLTNLFTIITYSVLALRFNQYTTYVALVLERYRLINEFIDEIYMNDLDEFERKRSLSSSFGDYKIAKNTDHLQRINRFKLIYDLRRSSHLLFAASEQLNTLYRFSFAACFIEEFVEIVCCNYFYIEYAINTGFWAYYGLAILQMFPRFLNIFWMTDTCERATEEV